MRAVRLTVCLLALLAGRAGAQDTAAVPAAAPAAVRVAGPLQVRDMGPGRPGRLLRAVLSRPHTVIDASGQEMPRALRLPRDSVVTGTLVIVNGDVQVASRVHGSIVVVNGGLFLQPGAEIDGDVVTYGDGIYNSALAIVRGDRHAFRDVAWALVPMAGGTALDYRELDAYEPPLVELIGVYGFNLPSYDRSAGLSLPWGPLVNLAGGRLELEPTAIYRSDLGAVDPWLDVNLRVNRRTRAELRAGRGVFTNESWIRGSLGNSFGALLAGSDVRNYYRADRAALRGTRVWETATGEVEPWIGALTERAWSTGPEIDPEHVVWSLLERRDVEDGMARPNPPVRKGRISSALVGADGEWEMPQMRVALSAQVEAPFDAPGGARFVQTTLDGAVRFPVVRTHLLVLETHALVTLGDSAPPQRHTYVGGVGTLPTLPTLLLGGDHAFFADARYVVSIERVAVPYLGMPTVALRYAVGSAGVGELPAFVQNVGIRLGLGPLKAEYMYDPKRRDSDVSIGLSFGR